MKEQRLKIQSNLTKQELVKDIIMMTSTIGKLGSVDRLYVRNVEIAKIIKYRDEEHIFIPQT
jgi:hypothetical protein